MRKYALGMMMLLLLTLFTNCSRSSRTAIVQSDANTDANLTEYNSYAFASQVDNQLDEGLYFLNDLMAKAQIRDAISHELGSRGYEKEEQNADLVVNFRVFDKPTTIRGLGDMGDRYWSGIAVAEPAEQQTTQVEAGTLMVHLVDKKTGKILWQGFASGIMDGNTITHDKTKIQQAVSSIFDRFAAESSNGGVNR